jgi:chromosome segregation ATPase
MEVSEQSLKLEIATLSSLSSKLKSELNDYTLFHEELTKKAEAESEMSAIARKQAADALRMRESLEDQIQALRSAHDSSLKRCDEMEEATVHLNGKILTLQSELATATERLREKESQLADSESQKAVAEEVESLRKQLSEMRRRLLKKDLDEETALISPATSLERDRAGRRVYENIIEDLREQLDRSSAAYHEALRKLNDANTKLLRVQELEDEVQLYKETAKKVAIESHR